MDPLILSCSLICPFAGTMGKCEASSPELVSDPQLPWIGLPKEAEIIIYENGTLYYLNGGLFYSPDPRRIIEVIGCAIPLMLPRKSLSIFIPRKDPLGRPIFSTSRTF